MHVVFPFNFVVSLMFKFVLTCNDPDIVLSPVVNAFALSAVIPDQLPHTFNSLNLTDNVGFTALLGSENCAP
jgi:hypothetical protein